MTSMTTVPCGFGNCNHMLDERGRIFAGAGPILCPCDHMPSWRKAYPDQMHQTSMSRAIKARGRHGSRVQRARRRHADVGPNGEWLPMLALVAELDAHADAARDTGVTITFDELLDRVGMTREELDQD